MSWPSTIFRAVVLFFATSIVADPSNPTSPSQVTLISVTQTSVTISWTPVADAAAYRILTSDIITGLMAPAMDIYAPWGAVLPWNATLTNLVQCIHFIAVIVCPCA